VVIPGLPDLEHGKEHQLSGSQGGLLVRGGLRSGLQFFPMAVQDRQQFVVVNDAEPATEVDLAQEPEVGKELSEPDVWRQSPDFTEDGESFGLDGWGHGIRSPIFGSDAKAFGNFPITSTRIRVPGASLAIRVARVTPL
jgi:hypothetical protein